MVTDIQYFAAHYVAFKDNLIEQEKSSLIKWIKENSDDKIKSLLIQGDYKFQQEAVDQFDKEFGLLLEFTPETVLRLSREGKPQEAWNAIWKLMGQQQTLGQAKFLEAAGGAAIAALVIAVSYALYKRFLSKSARSCRGLSRDKKTNCMNKYKRDSKKKRIELLTKGLSACNKTKNPNVCRNKITTKIRRLKVKLGAL